MCRLWEKKTVCIGLPHKVRMVPVVSFRLQVALYCVNKKGQCNKGKMASQRPV